MTKMSDKALFEKSRRYLVGGVDSPVRSFRSVGGIPIFIKSGRGSRIQSQDGHSLIDFCLSWGALILGHAPGAVVSTLKRAVTQGTSFGAPSATEIKLAALIQKGIPSIERIRFTNSGTEALMSAVRLARAYTKRTLIIKFDGGYHGHADTLLSTAGVPRSLKATTLTLPYNNLEKLEKALKRHGKKIAAVVVEPVAGNIGVILPQAGFLQGLRRLCDRYGVILIFDEVITGFRFCYGGAQDYFGVIPDLTCLGKVIGGGLPIGAFGGGRALMKLLAPEGPVYQAGTFSGNPLSMTAGIATLNILGRRKIYDRFWNRSDLFYEGLRKIARQGNIPFRLNAIGPMFSIFFTKGPVVDAATARRQDISRFRKFFHGLLKQGVYLSPSPLEANFLSLAHESDDLAETLIAVKNFDHKCRIVKRKCLLEE